MMKILVACEESQRVAMEFRKLGHEAYSADIQDCLAAILNGILKEMRLSLSMVAVVSRLVTESIIAFLGSGIY